MLSEYPLEPKELFKLEYKTIALIRNNPKLHEIEGNLYIDSDNALGRMAFIEKELKKRVVNEPYNYESWFLSEDGKYKIFVGGKFSLESKVEYDIITYYFAVFDIKKEKITRKYHFDFHKNNKPYRPFYHLQYAGRLDVYLKDQLKMSLEKVEKNEENLDCNIDPTRVPYMPMSLIQLMSLMIIEYLPSKAPGILIDTWLGHLKKSEKELCMPFHNKCQQAMRDDKSLLMDCFCKNY